MKKLLAVLLAVITVGCVFVACSKADDKKETTTKSESTSFTVQNPTDKAKIKDKDAIDFIKNAYTPEELGLDKVKEKYSFMISSNGEKIDKKEKNTTPPDLKPDTNFINKENISKNTESASYDEKNMEKDAYHEKEMLPEKEEDLHTSSASETFENSGAESFGDDGFDLFSSIENLI